MKHLLAVACLLFAVSAFAQPTLDWTRTWDYGPGGNDYLHGPAENLYHVSATPDRGYVLAGHTLHGGDYANGLIIRIDSNGNELWVTEVDIAADSEREYVSYVEPTADGGYIACGLSEVNLNGEGFVVKLDSDGTIQWTSLVPEWTGLAEVHELPDGSFATMNKGAVDFQYVQLYRFASDGTQTQVTSFNLDRCSSFRVCDDGGFIVAGSYRTGYDGSGFILMKIDAEANVEWTLDCSPPYDYGWPSDVELFPDGSGVACGWTGDLQLIPTLVWFTSDGTLTLGQPYPTLTNVYRFEDVIETADHGLLIHGMNNNTDAAFLARIGRYREFQWSMPVPSINSPMSMDIGSDGSIVLAGMQVESQDNFNMQAVKYEAEVSVDLEPDLQVVPASGGTIFFDADVSNTLALPTTFSSLQRLMMPDGSTQPVRQNQFLLQPNELFGINDIPLEIPASAPPGEYRLEALVGNWDVDHVIGYGSFAFEKLDPGEGTNVVADGSLATRPGELTLSASPNPFNPATTISLALPSAGEVTIRVLNVLGQQVAVVQDGVLPAGSHRFVFDGSALSSGVYFVQVQAGSESLIRKVLLTR
ncbi:T9SS type A sorting domain-containing protein [bacterium]|nr:T9SS type A sorting domain-containing protein [bacterium]